MNWRLLLFPFSVLYGTAVWFRNWLFDMGIMKTGTFSVPVICVGNISSGGTGKTPHAEYLIRFFLNKEKKVAVLSRGYGRKTSGYLEVTEFTQAVDCGDEPLQMKLKFPECIVAVCEKRTNGINRLLTSENRPDIIILDDAFQHRYVKPQKNILLTSLNHLYSEDYLLPAGNLREFRSGADRADVIIVTKCPENISDQEKTAIRNIIKTKTHQQLLFSHLVYSNPVSLNSHESKPLDEFKKAHILLFTGIADSRPLQNFLNEKCNQQVLISFPDHHYYSESNLKAIKQKFDNIASPEKIIITTEKDAVRLLNHPAESILKSLPVFYIPVFVSFSDDDKNKFSEFLNSHD